jgi:RNA polymerase sigma factor (TIGR02999 family)
VFSRILRSGDPFGTSLHYALRENTGKTVMALPDSRAASSPAPGSPEAGGREELDRLFSVTYEELRRLASTVRRGDPSATLNPTALVNEAWMKLARSPECASASRLHFKRIAARAMRQVLIEAARRRNAEKRGSGELLVTFDESTQSALDCGQQLLALDSALDELAKMQPRQAQLVEGRFFGGLDAAETAELLGVSEATILRDWRAAKAWLGAELRRAR